MKFINKLLRDEQGATAIEYGLIAALIAVAAITAMQSRQISKAKCASVWCLVPTSSRLSRPKVMPDQTLGRWS